VEKEVYLGLDGRAALVTGAGSGAGRAIALWLARAGCDVAIVDAAGDAAERVAEELRREDFTAIAVAADLGSEPAAEAMVAAVVAQFDSLDVAVNCLARPAPRSGRSADAPDRASNLALLGWCCRAEARAMGDHEPGGTVVNVVLHSSEAGTAAGPGDAAVEIGEFTRKLAIELAPVAVRVNSIIGAVTPTRDGGRGGPATRPDRQRTAPSPAGAVPAEELGRVAVFLASDLARGVTGQILRVTAEAAAGGNRLRGSDGRPRG
jgi:2-hydroxycyclohexanecarboxyl-CoA dehydrogenase